MLKSKETSSYTQVDKSDIKFICTFGLISSWVCKFAKSRDKLVNHSCQVAYS